MYELPENVNGESITARYENGILNISIPKTVPAEKPVKSIIIE
jgi:HSP20 family molecular chaperone IbpA